MAAAKRVDSSASGTFIIDLTVDHDPDLFDEQEEEEICPIPLDSTFSNSLLHALARQTCDPSGNQLEVSSLERIESG